MYVVTGATGNTGKLIASSLLEAGKKVRIISRNLEKAKDLVAQGAELFVGDTSDAEFLKNAFRGATVVYAMVPTDFHASDYTAHQVTHAKAIGEALKEAKVKFVVSLSSQGAHLAQKSGVVLGLHKMETIFNGIEGVNVLHLRPTYFMENSLGMIGLIKHAGIMGSPITPTLKFPVIATKDIANYAIKRLLALDFAGKSSQDLLGAREVSYPELALVYGNAIGIDKLQYVEFSYADFKDSLISQMGASESVADCFNEFIAALNDGTVLGSAVRNAESTTPTTIEEFAGTFKFVYDLQ